MAKLEGKDLEVAYVKVKMTNVKAATSARAKRIWKKVKIFTLGW